MNNFDIRIIIGELAAIWGIWLVLMFISRRLHK
jgi:hypothetical protein